VTLTAEILHVFASPAVMVKVAESAVDRWQSPEKPIP
jgi:hypothetical protein